MAGLLDFLNTDEGRLGVGLLASGGPTTDPNQSGLGQRLAAGLQFGDQSRQSKLREELLRSQMAENESQAALRAAQVAKQEQIQSLTSGLLGDFTGGTSMGGGSNVSAAAGLRGVPIEKIAALKAAGGPDLTEAWKAVNIPTSIAAGGYAFIPGQSPTYMADPSKGLGIGPTGVYALPGAAAAQGALEGAKTAAQEDAKAARDLVEVKGGDGRTYRVPRSQVLSASGAAPSTDPYVSAVEFTESRGNPLAVSPKGAMGPMQVMPGTSTSPGYGVAPAKDNSPAELRRVGQDYWAAMNDRYKNPALAAIAYNWGPDNADKWLKAGGDYDKLPAETKSYVSQVMTRGAVNSLGRPQGGAPMAGNVAEFSPREIATNKADEARAVDTAKADVVRDSDAAKKAKSAGAMIAAADRAIELLKQGPTASGAGEMADKTMAWFGKSNKGADIASKLDIVAGDLVNNVPRMEGPQSDGDRIEYKIQAGRAADRSLPVEQRISAAEEVKRLQGKYSRLNGGGPDAGGDSPAGRLKAPPSQSDLQNTALKYGVTVDEVKKRLGIQ